MDRVSVSLILAYDANGRLLLLKRRDSGLYSLPGGHVEEGESPIDCARRELREETGAEAFSLTHLPGVAENPPHLPRLHVFSALVGGTVAPHGHLDPDREAASFQFHDVAEGLAPEVYDRLHGPPGDLNVIRQVHQRGPEKSFPIAKSEVTTSADPLGHHDPRERAFALMTQPVSPHDLVRGALDDDPEVRAAALRHPDVGPAVLTQVAVSRRTRSGQHPGRILVDALTHPKATGDHARLALQAAQAHGPGAEAAIDVANQVLAWRHRGIPQ